MLRDGLDDATPALAARGSSLCDWQRDWDRTIWPHATAGFFKVKQPVPLLLRQLVAMQYPEIPLEHQLRQTVRDRCIFRTALPHLKGPGRKTCAY